MSAGQIQTEEQAVNIPVRTATPADGDAVAAIYNRYVTQTTVTFDEKEIPAAQAARRIRDDILWLVAESGGEVSGYACASVWKSRCGYRGATELGVYVARHSHRRGVADALLAALLARLAKTHHTAIACIALPNPASIALFEKHGFAKVGHFREVGCKFGKFIDTGYWQKILAP
jgi:phosphinothricin acetyltransferase